MPSNAVIFTTSCIFFAKYPESEREPYSWGEKKYQLPDGTIVYSHGRIEKAVEKGYTVYVVSTRKELGPHDEWWAKLIPAERIFFSDRFVEPTNLQVGNGWRKLFDYLGIEWPQRNGHDVFWTEAQAHLLDLGFIDGRNPLFKTKGELDADAVVQRKLAEIRKRKEQNNQEKEV